MKVLETLRKRPFILVPIPLPFVGLQMDNFQTTYTNFLRYFAKLF